MRRRRTPVALRGLTHGKTAARAIDRAAILRPARGDRSCARPEARRAAPRLAAL